MAQSAVKGDSNLLQQVSRIDCKLHSSMMPVCHFLVCDGSVFPFCLEGDFEPSGTRPYLLPAIFLTVVYVIMTLGLTCDYYYAGIVLNCLYVIIIQPKKYQHRTSLTRF